jgi:preprotein translocase subunit SecD
VAIIIKGINPLKSVTINIMSKKAIQTYVQGVNDQEKSQFVYSMANLRKFMVSVCNHDHQNNISVATMYNDNMNKLYAYSKQTIDDFTNMVRKPRVKKEKMNVKYTPQEIIEIKSNEDQQIITIIESREHTVAGYTNNEQEQV